MSYGQVESIHIETVFVKVPVTVIDRDGRYVANLKKENFTISEDGVDQEIGLFETTEQPFTALLLFDTSGSMNDYLADIARAANAFVGQMRPDDRITVATFSDQRTIKIILEPTKKRDFNQKILFTQRMGDSFTTTFNAVEKGIEYISRFAGRKAIILFSDGELYGKGASAKSNLRDAEEGEALIYTVRFGEYPTHQPGAVFASTSRLDRGSEPGMFGDRGRSGGSDIVSRRDLDNLGNSTRPSPASRRKLIERVNAYMKGLASVTGARSFQIDHIKDLPSTFQSVADELGRQYLLGYIVSNSGKNGERRRIIVRVDVPNVAVRSRNEVVYSSKK